MAPLSIIQGCLLPAVLLLGVGCPASEASQAAGQETLVGIVGENFVLLGADSSVSQGLALTASNLDKIAPIVEPFRPGDGSASLHYFALQQQAIVVAAAGNAAMSDRVVGQLQAYATIHEYDASVGCDVRIVDMDMEESTMPPRADPGLDVLSAASFARSVLSSNRPQASVCLLVAGMMSSNNGDDEDCFDKEKSNLAKQVQNQVEYATSRIHRSRSSFSLKDSNADISISPLHPRLYWLDELGSMQRMKYGVHGLGANFCLSILDQGYRQDMTLEEATQLLQDCFEQLRSRYVVNSPQPPCIKCVDRTGIRQIV